MMLPLRLAFLLPLGSMLTFAASWSGALVDSKCYTSAQQNVSHGHPGSTNTKRAVRSCSPNKKTNSFAIVQQVGMTFNLDGRGNEKAHELILKEGKKDHFVVNVTGDLTQETIKVDTISMAR
jgi:hypothetical protein